MKGIVLALVSAFLTAAAQIFFKFASFDLTFSVQGILLNLYLYFGFALFGIAAMLFIFALKLGEVTILYPMLASWYIWTSIAAPYFFPADSFGSVKALGVLTIILGMYFIGRGAK